MSAYLIALLVGLAAGTHAATWGMYKDSVYEGFSLRKYLRSIVLAGILAVAAQSVLGLDMTRAGSLVILFGVTYVLERGLFEFYKVFIRQEDQSKYFIPMQFSIRGIPVRHRGVRLVAGAAYVAGVSLCLMVIAGLDGGGSANRQRMTAGLVGLVTGLIIAVGGGWKDAPKEGFDPAKFMRSPALTVPIALFLSLLTDSQVLMALATIGYERAIVETYKKFLFPLKPPGKFSGMPLRYPEMLRLRRYFVPAYAGIWLLVLIAAAAAVQAPTARFGASVP